MNELQSAIKEELKHFRSTRPDIFYDEAIELFINVLRLPLNDPSINLEGLQTRVPNAIRKILIENLNGNDGFSFFPEFAKIEPFFKKLIYLIDPVKFREISSSRSGLAASIDYLGLNPGNLRLTSSSPESHSGNNTFMDHILRAYHFRNIESHVCKIWPKKEFYVNVESILVVYIYTIHLHYNALINIISPQDNYDVYLQKVVLDFDKWKERFVHITGIERFDEIPLHAIENENWGERESTALREGSVDELRKNIDESAMVVLGEPGMGKSTSLQYLSYNDAQYLLSNGIHDDSRIPIYIELKLLSKEESIIESCSRKLGLSNEKVVNLFTNGRATLFLDGLNEVFPDKRTPIRQEIQGIISEYSHLKLLITSRPLAYSNEFKDIPVFNLQRLNDIQVEDFLQKNCDYKRIRQIILDEIMSNTRFGKIVRVPLMLKMLVNVVHNSGGVIPSSKTKLIAEFLKNLYKRENEKMIDTVDLRIVHRLLCFLGHTTRNKNASNVGWRIEQFETLIETRIEKSRFSINVYQFIDMAVDLHILVRDGEKYSFIHELYQEYFASEELFRLNAVSHD